MKWVIFGVHHKVRHINKSYLDVKFRRHCYEEKGIVVKSIVNLNQIQIKIKGLGSVSYFFFQYAIFRFTRMKIKKICSMGLFFSNKVKF